MPVLRACIVLVAFLGLVHGCNGSDAKLTLSVGYRPSVPGELGVIWAHEKSQFREFGIKSRTQAFGPPSALLEALRNGTIDIAASVPLEPVIEDIRSGEANYLIYCLQCYSPTSQFDAIVTRRNADGSAPTWDDLAGGTLGVLPSLQSRLIGKEIIKKLDVEMTVRAFNPQNALLGITSGDFDAIHAHGADVARAKSNPDRFAILEVCSASRILFNDRVTPAAVGLISAQWVRDNPDLATKVVNTILTHTKRVSEEPDSPELLAILQKQKYGAFPREELRFLEYAPIIHPSEIDRQDFLPLLVFLREHGVQTPETETILNYVFRD